MCRRAQIGFDFLGDNLQAVAKLRCKMCNLHYILQEYSIPERVGNRRWSLYKWTGPVLPDAPRLALRTASRVGPCRTSSTHLRSFC